MKNIILCSLFLLIIFRTVQAQGNYLDFDGNDDFIQTSIHNQLAEVTIEVVFTADEIKNGLHVLVDNGGGGNGSQEIMLWVGASHLKAGRWYGISGEVQAGIVAGQCYHATAVFTSQYTKLYLDGNLQGVDSTLNPIAGSILYNWCIGAGRNGSVNAFEGQIDEVRLWSTERTAIEIQSTIGVGLTGLEPGLIAYYDFDQGQCGGSNGAIQTLLDRTPAGNHGSLTNFSMIGCNSNWVCGGSPCGYPCSGTQASNTSTTVPTLSQWGLIILAMLIAAHAAIQLSNRRSAKRL